jgi:hypothetical protein
MIYSKLNGFRDDFLPGQEIYLVAKTVTETMANSVPE